MTIFRTNNAIEAYRAWAKTSADVSYLSGRGKNQLVTEFISREILKHLEPRETDVLVDIGCGDGTLLNLAIQLQSAEEQEKGTAVGVLPTVEEVGRLNAFLIERKLSSRIRIIHGLAQKIPLPDEFADLTVANGVFLLLPDEASIDSALQEMYRITKRGGKIFIGELPCLDEHEVEKSEPEQRINSFKYAILSRIYSLLKQHGFRGMVTHIKNSIVLRVSKKITVVIAPPQTFWMDPTLFAEKLKDHKFSQLRCWKHPQIDDLGEITESQTRYNYLVIKD